MVYVLGAGSVGCFLAARLSTATPVTLIARDASSADLRGGLRLEAAPGTEVPPTWPGELQPAVVAQSECGSLEPGAWVLIATKLYQLRDAMAWLAPRLDGSQRLVLCQNGVGAIDEARAHGKPRAAGWGRAVCWFGVRLERPSRVLLGGSGPVEIAMEAQGAAELATLLRATKLEVAILSTVREAEWRKALWNISNNGLAALADSPNGALIADPGLRSVLDALFDEAAAVARAEGYPASEEDRQRVLASIGRTSANVNSLLQDLRVGRPTEMPWLNAAVVGRARALGLRAPVNEAIAALIQYRESGAAPR